MDFIKEVVLPTILLFLIIFALIFSIVYSIDYSSCQGFGKGTGHRVVYEMGCYVEVNGEYIPRDYVYGTAQELRLKDVTKH